MDNSFNIRLLLRILFKHKYRILSILIVTMATVISGTMLLPPVFEASSTFMVKFGREYVYSSEVGNAKGPVNYFNRDAIINAEIEILTSPDLFEKLITDIGIENLYPELLKDVPQDVPFLHTVKQQLINNLSVLGSDKSNIIRVSFKHTNPETAANVVNKLLELFQEKHLETFSDPRASAFIEEKLKDYHELLKNSEEKVTAFRQKHSSFSRDDQLKLILKQRADLKVLSQETDSESASLQEKLISLESQIALINTEEVQANIRTMKSKLYQEIEKEIVLTRADLNSYKAKSSILKEQLKKVDRDLRAATAGEQEFRDIMRELEVNEQNYKTYLKKLEETRLSDEMDRQKMTNIRVVQAATPPFNPIAPNKKVNIIFGIIFGLFAGLGFAFLKEYFNQGFDSKESVEKRLKLPVLTMVGYKR